MRRPVAILVALAIGLAAACSAGGDGATADRDDAGPGSTTTAAAASPDDVVPEEDWAVAVPEEHGIDPAGLEGARSYAFAPEKNTQGVVVVRGGEIVAEWYADGADRDSWAASWSMAKSVTSAAMGIAIDEGHIGGVDEPVATYIPEWAGTDREDITIEDLLQMSSGLEWNEDYRGTVEESDITNMVTSQPDELAFATSRPRGTEPGTEFSYSSGDTMLLSGILEEATGQPADAYAREVLLDRIGMDPVEWWRDAGGHTLTYCCLDTTSRDFARFGLLYLRDGRWGDDQVVPEAWIDESLEPSDASEGSYGYQWWVHDIEGVPDDAFMAIGVDEQYTYVVPSLDLVVVRNGTYDKHPGAPVADPALFPLYPVGGLVSGKGTAEPDEWDSSAFLQPIVESIQD